MHAVRDRSGAPRLAHGKRCTEYKAACRIAQAAEAVTAGAGARRASRFRRRRRWKMASASFWEAGHDLGRGKPIGLQTGSVDRNQPAATRSNAHHLMLTQVKGAIDSKV